MKLVIIGGSAASTPHLLTSAALRPVLPEMDVVLVGRSSDNVKGVARAARELNGDSVRAPALASFEPSELRDALRDADIVLVQVRCGGYAGRAFDETFPLRYGMCGDEGLGAGGLSAAWRAWPELRDVFDAAAQACAAAMVLVMTSPVSLLVRCVLTAYPNLAAVGICELPWTTLQAVCNTVGADARDADFGYAGVNHFGWFARIRAGGRDVVAEYSTRCNDDDGFPSRALIESCGGIPLKYLRLYYERANVVREQRAAMRPRGAELEALQREALAVFAGGDRAAIGAVLRARPAPWYEHAIAPLIAAAAGVPAPIPYFLTVKNAGMIPWLENDDIVEIPHRAEGPSVRPMVSSVAVPERSQALLAAFVGCERTAAAAVLDRSADGLAATLERYPWSADSTSARAMAEEIVASSPASASSANVRA